MSSTEIQTHVTVEIKEGQAVASSDGEITVTVENPNGGETVLSNMRKRLFDAETAVDTPHPPSPMETISTRVLQSYHWRSRRVPQSLVDISSIAIAPEMVSIGPFYHGKEEPLLEFETTKWRFLRLLLSRIKSPAIPDRLGELYETVQKLESRARAFYEEELNMSSPDFIQMLVLDGCFIIELFRHLSHEDPRIPLYINPWLIPIITRDLLKLENQLPFFILAELFRVTAIATDVEDPLSLLALKFFKLSLPRPNDEDLKKVSRYAFCRSHLLHLFHTSLYPPTVRIDQPRSPFRLTPVKLPPYLAFPLLPPLPEQSRDRRASLLIRYWSVSIPIFCLRWSVAAIFYLLRWSIAILRQLCIILSYCLWWSVTRFLSLILPNSEEHRHSVQSVQSITQLRPSGVKFKPHIANSFLDINFKKRALRIPPITINHLTITVFINCLALEHWQGGNNCFFTHYIAFLSCLINSPKDVAFLCGKGIIASYSHNDYYIATLFNKLGEKIYVNRQCHGYLDREFKAVEAYYHSHWATFMRNYFSTPWSFISVVSAIILLVLTASQTVLAVLSYINKAS